MLTAGNSLYVHIPFCRRRCHYCHFYVLRDSAHGQELYWTALQKEWERRGSLIQQPLVTCYFGGGTPSLADPIRIARFLAQLPNQPDEITLEANPEECTPERLAAFRAAGVNRLSIGIQTLDEPLLHTLNRLHSSIQAENAVWNAAAAGFANITVDLMYDLPNQTLSSWSDTLRRASQLPITHLSLYNLVIEPGSFYARRQKAVQSQMPDEALSMALWDTAHQVLGEAGFNHYALSAFERGGHPSNHNLGYWTGRPFLGLGPSAWSYLNGCRIQNLPDLAAYSDRLLHDQDPIGESEQLDAASARKEALVLGLRLALGIDRTQFEVQWGALAPETVQDLSHLCQMGLLKSSENRWQATSAGFRLFDSIASTLV